MSKLRPNEQGNLYRQDIRRSLVNKWVCHHMSHTGIITTFTWLAACTRVCHLIAKLADGTWRVSHSPHIPVSAMHAGVGSWQRPHNITAPATAYKHHLYKYTAGQPTPLSQFCRQNTILGGSAYVVFSTANHSYTIHKFPWHDALSAALDRRLYRPRNCGQDKRCNHNSPAHIGPVVLGT